MMKRAVPLEYSKHYPNFFDGEDLFVDVDWSLLILSLSHNGLNLLSVYFKTKSKNLGKY